MSLRWASFLVIVGVMGAVSGNLLAQNDLSDLLKPKKPKVNAAPPKATVTVTAEPETFTPGGNLKLVVKATIPAGYHIYGTDGDFGGRTMIRIDTPGLEPLGDRFVPNDPGKTAFDPDLDAKVTKHEGTIAWTREFRTPPGIAGDGSLTVNGLVEGQYCSDPEDGGRCVPLKHPFELSLKMGEATAAIAPPTVRYEDTLKPARKGSPNADPVDYLVRLTPIDAAKGDTVTLTVTAKLRTGWHTYSLTQKDIGGEPTEIELVTLRNLEPIDEEFASSSPPDKETGTMGNVLETHHDEITWTRTYRMTGEQAGAYAVTGDIRYQLCDAIRCLPVHAVPFTLGQLAAAELPPIEMPADEPVVSPFAPVVAEEAPKTEVAVAPPAVAKPAAAPKPQDKGLLPFLLLCVGGGFLALLTPCSFPMVPITVSFFLKQSEKEHRRPWLLALVYCGTIVLAFTVLGVGIAFLFGAAKLNALANNPWINTIIATVFIAFAINMLGGFEIRLPTSLLNWSSTHSSGGSYAGAVFMALTFTLTSFTCTFAVAGSLLVAASQGDVYWPVVGMLAFGTAFASPFFVLAMLPQLLKKLPKSGGWMNSVKVVMGLIEIGAAVKFLSVADLTLNPTPILFDFVTVMLTWMVLALAIALYLLGVYRFAHDTPTESISPGRALLALSFLGLTGMLGFLTLQPDRASGWIMDTIVSFAPPRFDEPHADPPAELVRGGNGADVGPTIEHHGLRFALNMDKAREVARTQRRPILIDFTGVNCQNCRRMEKKMAEPENRRRIEQFVAVQLYVDKVPVIADADLAEQMLKANVELQQRLVQDVSMPSYVIITPDGVQVLATHIGYAPGNEFTDFLDEGWRNWQAREQVAGR
ncbi:MAG: cytochrome c biogenesis protein CcdA [Planctomycetaceae bacterium]|nr:cytochrome c biogenesis protein CcdA [Planctomycetaceae bacterium]